jgi:hypothetical protein
MKSKLYHGIPEDTWDSLLFKAEDLLRDNKLGNHIVGIYPIGSIKHKGIDPDRAPGIFCLYIDSVEFLLDPTTEKHGLDTFQTPHGYILMMELYEWVENMFSCKSYTRLFDMPIPLMPFQLDVIHEDESIGPVMAACHGVAYSPMTSTKEEVGKLVAQLYRSLA